ncbi:MAG: hypothetical protein CXZ00_08855 [Acidobacteria bacterium]|nr:MAG: hypothetical protein CXZ00_08855 [Acidobacteriota bacterium]
MRLSNIAKIGNRRVKVITELGRPEEVQPNQRSNQKSKKIRKLPYSLIRLAGFAVLLAALCGSMHADVGLFLNEALKVGASQWTGAGHSAVYLSGVCAASPVKLRLCRPDENGVVLTNYPSFGEDRPYEWNAIPLNVYLYGVEDESARPLYASPMVRWILQDRYRQKYLTSVCTGRCATNPRAYWRDTVGTVFLRDVYLFKAKTTEAQDRKLVEKYNSAKNQNRYNGYNHNCASFARDVVNSYFPGAAKADRINDFGATGPKAVAKSFARYGAKHPELEFQVVRFSQIPGEYAPSQDNRKGTEELCRANRWRLLSAFGTIYAITGRFDPERELQRRPSGEVITLEAELREAQAKRDRDQEEELNQKIRFARLDALGAQEDWFGYEASVRRYEAEAVERGYISSLDNFRNLASHVASKSWITLDEKGGMWLNARNGESQPKVGLSANTLTETASDVKLGYLLALSRVDAELRKKPKDRATITFFRKDWELLEQLRERLTSYIAGTRPPEAGKGATQ